MNSPNRTYLKKTKINYIFAPKNIFKFILGSLVLTHAIISHAQQARQFNISYDASLSIDANKSANTGLSKNIISALSSALGGSIVVGGVNDTISFSKDAYHIKSVGSLGSILSVLTDKNTFTRISDGQVINGSTSTLRYVDSRAGSAPLTTLVDSRSQKIIIYDGKKVTAKTDYRGTIQDLLCFGYGFIGKLPSGVVSVNIADGKSIKQAIFDIRKETIKSSQGAVDTVKLTRRLSAKDDASVEYWLRNSDGIPLRIRIGMSQRYGATLILSAVKPPEKVTPL